MDGPTIDNIPQAFDNPFEPPPTSDAERRRRRKLYLSEAPSAVARIRRHVYFVEGGGLIKIGSAFDIKLRFQQLCDSSPVPMRLVAWSEGGEQLERKLHRSLKSRRHHGEWFAITFAEIKAQWKDLLK